jgi:hypothetical protein
VRNPSAVYEDLWGADLLESANYAAFIAHVTNVADRLSAGACNQLDCFPNLHVVEVDKVNYSTAPCEPLGDCQADAASCSRDDRLSTLEI